MKILLIDDDADLLEMTGRRLRKKGVTVIAVSDLTQARAAFDAPGAGFDGVVSDLFLAEENGLTFFEHTLATGFDGVFVLVTGDEDGDPRVRPFRQAHSHFHCLQKPYSLDALLEVLGTREERSA